MSSLPPSSAHRWRHLSLAALLYLAVALFMTSGALFSGQPRAVGADYTETWNWLWAQHWMADSLLHEHTWPFRTSLLDHPYGGVIWLKDPLSSLAVLPVQILGGLPLAHNLRIVLIFVASGLAFYLLARSLGVRHLVASLVGLGYAFMPYALGQAYNANTEALGLQWAPLWLWAMLRLTRQPAPGRVLLGGVLLACLLAGNQYYAMAMALVSLPFLWTALRAEPGGAPWRMSLLAVGATVALGLLLFAPAGLMLWRSVQAPDHLTVLYTPKGFTPPYVTDLKQLLLPLSPLSGATTNLPPYQDIGYPGFLVLLGCLLAPWLGPRSPWRWFWPAAGLSFLLLALGSTLTCDGHVLRVAGRALPMPWYWLVSGTPILHNMTQATRMAAPAGLFFSLGMAWSLEGLLRRWPRGRTRALVVGFSALALLEILTWPPYAIPLETVDVQPPEHAHLLARLPVEGAVLNLPLHLAMQPLSRYTWWQVTHGRPIAESLRQNPPPHIAAHIPWLGELASYQQGVRYLRGARFLGFGTGGGASQPPRGDPLLVARQLGEAGFAYVVLHRWFLDEHCDPGMSALWVEMMEATLGPGCPLDDGTTLYGVGEAAQLSLRPGS